MIGTWTRRALLGAAVAEVGFRHKLGRKAIYTGIFCGLMPDFDIFLGAMTGPWGDLIYHRGPTHSLFFAPLVAPLIGGGFFLQQQRTARAPIAFVVRIARPPITADARHAA